MAEYREQIPKRTINRLKEYDQKKVSRSHEPTKPQDIFEWATWTLLGPRKQLNPQELTSYFRTLAQVFREQNPAPEDQTTEELLQTREHKVNQAAARIDIMQSGKKPLPPLYRKDIRTGTEEVIKEIRTLNLEPQVTTSAITTLTSSLTAALGKPLRLPTWRRNQTKISFI